MGRPRCLQVVSVGVLGGASLALGAGCGAAPPIPVEGKAGMLDRTAAKKLCDDAAKNHDRPFVVDWDATDLSTFEAKAARDVVFVRYEGCDLEVLMQCSDPKVPGKLGGYGTPHFTSGTEQSFAVENEGELYAKLPLGAASFSGRVARGESLRLLYFVTGLATASREAVHRGELAAHPGCEGATHFVWGYNLGAFQLQSESESSVEGGASSGLASLGGKARTSEASLGRGGKLDSCETQDQRSCRVPIRLLLRPVQKGDGEATVVAAPGGDAPSTTAATTTGSAEELLAHARLQREKWDGAGCLATLGQALRQDGQLMGRADYQLLHAHCTMMSGDCDGGQRAFRGALAKADVKRELQDWQLDRETRKAGNAYCPSATAKNDADFLLRAVRELKRAAQVTDAKTCEALIGEIHERAERIDVSTEHPDFDLRGRAQSLAGNAYAPAASCVAAGTGDCDKGRKITLLQCRGKDPSFRPTCVTAMEASWTRERKHLECR